MGLCGNSPWGPWEDGMFTQCFQQVTLNTAIALFMIVGAPYRLLYLRRNATIEHKIEGILPWTKILLCSIVPMCYVVALCAKFVHLDWEWYQVISDIRDIFSWVLCTGVLVHELKVCPGQMHWWGLRLWWVLQYISHGLMTQAAVPRWAHSLDEYGQTYFITLLVVELVCIALLTILALWVKDPHSEEDGSFSSLRTYGSFEQTKIKSKNPYERASLWSKLLFTWASELMTIGSQRVLEFADIWELDDKYSAEYYATVLEQHWAKQQHRSSPSLLTALTTAHRRPLAIAAGCKALQMIGVLNTPLIVELLLYYIGVRHSPVSVGVVLAFVLFFLLAIQSLAHTYHDFISNWIGTQVKYSLLSSVFQKNISINASNTLQFDKREVAKFGSSYIPHLASTIVQLNVVWSAPIQVLVAFIVLWNKLRFISAVVALVLVLLIIGFSRIMAWRALVNRTELQHLRNEKLTAIGELLSNISMESPEALKQDCITRANDIRQAELPRIRNANLASAAANVIFFITPLCIPIIVYILYTGHGHVLTPRTVFSSLLWFGILFSSISELFTASLAIHKSKSIITVLQQYLLMPDKESYELENDSHPEGSIVFNESSFVWSHDPVVTLRSLNFQINTGELIAIVGPKGSGKSSLLAAILGEMHYASGTMSVNGSIAYVQQDPWLQNTTIRENITLGTPLNVSKYQLCVESCDLTKDFQALPRGDETEIGERGIELSNELKQRICLARALYRNASIYLLDTILAQTDSELANQIYDNAIVQVLRNKTRVVVTDRMDFLQKANKIIVFKAGQVATIGTYATTFASFNSPLSGLKTSTLFNSPEDIRKAESQELSLSNGFNNTFPLPGFQCSLLRKWEYYKQFLSHSLIYLTAILIFYAGKSACLAETNVIIADWADNTDSQILYFWTMLIAFGAASSLASLLGAITVIKAALNFGRKMHATVLERVETATHKFLQSHTGMLRSIFTRDINFIDDRLAVSILDVLATALHGITIIIVISIVTPFFLVALLPLSYIFSRKIMLKYVRTSSCIHYLHRVSSFPVHALLSETLKGAVTVRSTGSVQEFINNNNHNLNENMTTELVLNAFRGWLTVRIGLISAFVVFMATFFALLERSTISTGFAGFSIVYALQLGPLLYTLVETASVLEADQVSLANVLGIVDTNKTQAQPIKIQQENESKHVHTLEAEL